MKRTKRTYWLISAAAALAIGSDRAAHIAQYRVAIDGHALDANSRVGSGGLNAQLSRARK